MTPQVSVVSARPTGDWHDAAVAIGDGGTIVHVSGGAEDLPGVAAAVRGVARTGAFDQLVLDVSPDGIAEAWLDELLQPDVAVLRRLDRISTVALLVHTEREAALRAALDAARAGIAVVRLGARVGADGAARAIARLADLHLTFTDADADALRDRYRERPVHVVGNPVVDAVRHFAHVAKTRAVWRTLGLETGRYVLASPCACGLGELAARERVVSSEQGRGYIDHLSLLRGAGAVVTASPRLRAEADALGIHWHADGAAVAPLTGADRPAPKPIPLRGGRSGARVAQTLVANFARVRLV